MQKINNVNSDFTIKTIKQMNIELFGGCNLGCPMCPQTDNGREKEFKRSMNFDLFKKIIDEAIPRGLQYVNIGGSGEPTMSKYLVVSQLSDTIGGEITAIATGVPAGWGEPVFDKLHADIGKAMLSINAVHSFRYGFGGVDIASS